MELTDYSNLCLRSVLLVPSAEPDYNFGADRSKPFTVSRVLNGNPEG